MKLWLERDQLRIEADPRDVRDLIFIEEVLGLREDGDTIPLVRKNFMFSKRLAYLKAGGEVPAEKEDAIDIGPRTQVDETHVGEHGEPPNAPWHVIYGSVKEADCDSLSTSSERAVQVH